MDSRCAATILGYFGIPLKPVGKIICTEDVSYTDVIVRFLLFPQLNGGDGISQMAL